MGAVEPEKSSDSREPESPNVADMSQLAPFQWEDDVFMKEWETAIHERRVGTKIIDGRHPQIYRLSDTSICKLITRSPTTQNFGPIQMWTMHLVSTQTTIPVPPVRRVVVAKEFDLSWLDMEYVEGLDLDDVWPSASWRTRLKIVWTLRGYIQQLRKVRAPFPNVPGPITWNGQPNPCLTEPEFGYDGAGPFATYEELTRYFETMRALTLHGRFAPYNPTIRIRDHFDATSPLVLSHCDLHFGNIRVGTDGKLWLLDWGRAGLYPVWFESFLLSSRQHPDVPPSFQWFCWIICGWYPLQRKYMLSIRRGLYWARGRWRLDERTDSKDVQARAKDIALLSHASDTSIGNTPIPTTDRILELFEPFVRILTLLLQRCVQPVLG